MEYQGLLLDFAQPFRRASMQDLVRDATDVDFREYSASGNLEDARAAAAEALTKAGASHGGVQAIQGGFTFNRHSIPYSIIEIGTFQYLLVNNVHTKTSA